MSPTSGSYQLNTQTDPLRIVWHADVPQAKDAAQRGHWNAYLDQALGAVHSSGPWIATIFDVPNFPEPAYPPAGQLADYPAIGWESMEKRARVSPFTLRHELDVLSTKAALISALRTN